MTYTQGMNKHADRQHETLWLITKALYRASAVAFGFFFLTIPVLFLTDYTYAIHNSIVPMERMAYNELMFGWFGDLKILIMVCLLCPAIGLHWTLARHSGQSGE